MPENFELPEDLTALSDAELSALLEAARAEGAALSAADTFSSADADRLEVLAAAMDTIQAQLDANAAADADLAARRDAVAARFAAPAVEETPAAEVVDATVTPVEDLADATEVEETEEVVAAATAPTGRQIVARAPRLSLPANQPATRAVIAAAADVADVAHGSTFANLREVAPHAIRQMDSVRGASNGTKRGIFTIETRQELVASGASVEADTAIVRQAVDQARLANGQGLLAAGGWCAPTPQEYEICTTGEIDGIFDAPTVSVPRGSLSYFQNLPYGSVVTAVAAGQFEYTDAELQVEPPVEKPCFEIPCLDPVTVTLDVVGLCIRGGILQRRAFPELTAAWLDQAMVVHAHYVNSLNIAEVVAGSTNLGALTGTFGALAAFLEALDIQAADIRFDEGRAVDYPVEILLPWWTPMIFRADLSRRANDVNWRFSRAELVSLLADRNIRAQFVKDYVDAPFAGAGTVTALPTSIPVVMYPAGAWAKGVLDIIRVDALQDSTLLTTNREQLLFMESGRKMFRTCGVSRRFTVPVCASGEAAGLVDATGAPVCAAES